jgi:hypothetical protein
VRVFIESRGLKKKKMLNILTLSLCASLLIGAQSKQTSQTVQSTERTVRVDAAVDGRADVSASMSQSVNVRYGQEVVVPGYKFKIKFVAVPEDSRCPKGVNCIWAGNVRVRLQVSKARSKPVKVELSLNPRDFPDGETANYGNYKIKLKSVEPYPVADQQLNARDYTVTLDISKK